MANRTPTGTKNKGWKRTDRIAKRAEAEARNAKTLPEKRRAFARQFGYKRNSARIANGLEL